MLSTVTIHKKIKILAPFLLAVLLYGCQGEEIILPGDISGYIQDADSEEPVSEAQVLLFHLHSLVATDTTRTDGTFLFTGLDPLSYNIEVNKDMYESYYANLIVSSAATLEIEIDLQGESASKLSNAGGGIMSYEIIPMQDWTGVYPGSGEITQHDSFDIFVN